MIARHHARKCVLQLLLVELAITAGIERIKAVSNRLLELRMLDFKTPLKFIHRMMLHLIHCENIYIRYGLLGAQTCIFGIVSKYRFRQPDISA